RRPRFPQQRFQFFLSFDEGLTAQILAVEKKQVESHIMQVAIPAFRKRTLQERKAAAASVVKSHHLAIDQRIELQPGEYPGERFELVCPILAAAGVEPRVVARQRGKRA